MTYELLKHLFNRALLEKRIEKLQEEITTTEQKSQERHQQQLAEQSRLQEQINAHQKETHEIIHQMAQINDECVKKAEGLIDLNNYLYEKICSIHKALESEDPNSAIELITLLKVEIEDEVHYQGQLKQWIEERHRAVLRRRLIVEKEIIEQSPFNDWEQP